MCSSRWLYFLQMRWMATRTDQLVHIAKLLAPKFTPRESEVGAQDLVKAFILSLKQFHAHYYRLYEKGTTRAMMGLQGLHSSDAFWCLNMSARVCLKSFYPWCPKFGCNTATIVAHLRKVHYRLAIMVDVYQSFASMLVQVVLGHWSKCKVNSHKKSKMRKPKEAS